MHIFIRVLSILLIFIIFFYDCYSNNFVLSILKYYLLFFMLFTLWYRISTYFRHEAPFIDKILYEGTYCAPNVVYVNLTQEELDFLNNYLKDPRIVDVEFLSTFIWAQPPVAYYKRFVYSEVKDMFSFIEETISFAPIPYKFVYKNNNTQRYFPVAWLKDIDGLYYVMLDDKLFSVDNFFI